MFSRNTNQVVRKMAHEGLASKAGSFFMRAFRATGFSRKEAADRIGVTEGYLTVLLAGRIANPSPEIVHRAAAHWGFDVLDFYTYIGIVTSEHISTHCMKANLSLPTDVSMIYQRLMAIPVSQRQQLSETLLKMIDTVTR